MSGAYNPTPTVAPEVGAQPYEHLDLGPDAFGGGVAQSLEEAGQTLKQVGEQQFHDALALQEQHNETLVLDASSDASQKIGEIEAEYRQLHGNDAVTQLPDFQKRIAEVGETIAKTMPSPATQRAFHARFTSYSDQTNRGFGLYAADQADQAHVSALEGSIGAAKSRLVRESGLGNAAPNYNELVDNVSRLGVKLGWDKPQVTAYLQKQTGDVVADMVEARIAANQVGQAQNIFNAAAKAEVPGTDVPFLDADSQARISHTIHMELKSREALSRAENFEDAHNLAESDIQSRMLTGKPLPADAQTKIRAGFTPKQFEAYKAGIARADMVYKETGDIRQLPTAEITGSVERLKPAGGELDFNDRNAAYAHAVQIAQNEITKRKTDPGQAVRDAFPTTVGVRWQAYEEKPSPETLQAALKASEVAQTTLGIPALSGRREGLMPVNLARNIAGNIASAPPGEAYKQLQSWGDQFGPYWNKAFRQMSNLLPPSMKVAAIMPDPAAASLLIETSRQDPNKIRKALDVPASGANSLAHIIATDPEMIDLRQSLSQRQGGGGTADAVAQSVETLALGLMQTQGITSMSEAVDTALKRVIKDKYAIGHVNDRPFHVQANRDIGPIEQGAAAIMQGMKPGDFDLPPDVPRGMTRDDANAQWATAIRDNGYWVTNDDASGLILYAARNGGLGVPVKIKGKPVMHTWDELQRASINRKPSVTEEVLRSRIPGAN